MLDDDILKTPGKIRGLKSYKITNLEESEYRYLDWKDSSFVRVGSIKGESSIIHCIMQALLDRNEKESKEGKVTIVKRYREEISDFITFDKFRKSGLLLCFDSNPDVEYPSVKYIRIKLKELNIKTDTKDLFESVAYQSFISYVKEYNNPIGEEILEFLCENINVNVYVVDIEGKMKNSIISSARNLCVVLLKNDDDYEIIGTKREGDHKIILYFKSDHQFIKGLK